MPDRLIDPDSLATDLGIPVRTLSMWRYRRTGPSFVRVGKAIRYRESDVNRWIEAQRQDTDS